MCSMMDEEEPITPWDSHIEQFDPAQRRSTNPSRQNNCKLVALHQLDRLKTNTIDMNSNSKKVIYMPRATKAKKLTRFSESTEPTEPTLEKIAFCKKQECVKYPPPSLLPQLTLYRSKMMTRPFAMESINYERRYSPKQSEVHEDCSFRNKKHNSIIQSCHASNNKDAHQNINQTKLPSAKPTKAQAENQGQIDQLSQNQIQLLKKIQSKYKSGKASRAIKLLSAVQLKQKEIATGIRRYNLFRF